MDNINSFKDNPTVVSSSEEDKSQGVSQADCLSMTIKLVTLMDDLANVLDEVGKESLASGLDINKDIGQEFMIKREFMSDVACIFSDFVDDIQFKLDQCGQDKGADEISAD